MPHTATNARDNSCQNTCSKPVCWSLAGPGGLRIRLEQEL